MRPRVDIVPGLFTDYANGSCGRWLPSLVRYLPAYNDVPAGLLALNNPDLEPDFLLLRQLLARPADATLRGRVRAAGGWFDDAADLIKAGKPLTWQSTIDGRPTAAWLVYAWLLINHSRGSDTGEFDEVNEFRRLVGLAEGTKANIRMARQKAREVDLTGAAGQLGAACADELDRVLSQRSTDLGRKRPAVIASRARLRHAAQVIDFPTGQSSKA
jgi:hypothetical protein